MQLSGSRPNLGAIREAVSEPTRILLIDDEPNVCEYMHTLLTRMGMQVVSVPNGAEGLRRFDETQPDLVMLDLMLPGGMDGLEALRRFKQRRRDVPVVIFSGHGQARNIVVAMRRGAADFLQKPVEAKELERSLQRALQPRGEGVCTACGGTGRSPA